MNTFTRTPPQMGVETKSKHWYTFRMKKPYYECTVTMGNGEIKVVQVPLSELPEWHDSEDILDYLDEDIIAMDYKVVG